MLRIMRKEGKLREIQSKMITIKDYRFEYTGDIDIATGNPTGWGSYESFLPYKTNGTFLHGKLEGLFIKTGPDDISIVQYYNG